MSLWFKIKRAMPLNIFNVFSLMYRVMYYLMVYGLMGIHSDIVGDVLGLRVLSYG